LIALPLRNLFAHSPIRAAPGIRLRVGERHLMAGIRASSRIELTEPPLQETQMCLNEERGTRQAEIRVYREKIRAEGRAGHAAHRGEAGERRRRRNVAQRLSQRWRRVRRRYGLSREDYETLLARQGGACGICKQPVAEPLVVDRSSTTGRVRGLLCRMCKAGLVCFEEDLRLLLRATAYREEAVRDDWS
jgi:Recombination endonuclease VII